MKQALVSKWRSDDLKTLDWPTKPTICKNSSCVCVHDIRSRKFQHE